MPDNLLCSNSACAGVGAGVCTAEQLGVNCAVKRCLLEPGVGGLDGLDYA